MDLAYTICAVAGSVVLLTQLALTLFGGDGFGDHDGAGHIDFDSGHMDVSSGMPDDTETGEDYLEASSESFWAFEMLSFRALAALFAFFGLGGLAAREAGSGPYPTFLVAALAGVLAMVLVAWLMRLLLNLRSEGTVSMGSALGAQGVVYLTIPGEKQGPGKVTVTVQNRTMEYEAVTGGDPLPTGTQIEVVDIVGPNTVEVERVV
ncbi:MAG: NfeD family protein [Candidatus Omnitrophica bacterium]|nr:hypothetical protein [bacterium]NUN97768.1 NfeD family protein [Candidatus Omnitrophota bacterium]